MWKAWTPTLMVGKDVYGATLGLIGFGRIGQAVAKRAIGFDMKVMYFDSQRNPDAEKQTGAQYATLEGLLAESDFVSVHLPLSDRTRHMIGKAEFSAMKRDAIFINTARGAVVNEAELIEALQSGVIGGAGLDVYEQEPLPLDSNLFQLANVVMVPHIGSASLAARRKMAIVAAINVEAVLSGKEPVDPVLP
jgi:glyoxylate reductase